jgi:hypothetical protein
VVAASDFAFASTTPPDELGTPELALKREDDVLGDFAASSAAALSAATLLAAFRIISWIFLHCSSESIVISSRCDEVLDGMFVLNLENRFEKLIRT